MIVVGVWAIVQEMVLMPFRLIRNVGSNVLSPGVPWIAVVMTFFWCVFEAIIFTFVTTSLVIDTLSNLAGTQLTETGGPDPALPLHAVHRRSAATRCFRRSPTAVKSRDWPTIVKIGVVESVAMFVEVVFLYREFVDALVPWFAQHTSGKFELGIAGTLAIARPDLARHPQPVVVPVRVRGHAHDHRHHPGTGRGEAARRGRQPADESRLFSDGFCGQLRKEFDWVGRKGQASLGRVPGAADAGRRGGAQLRHAAVLNRHLLDLPLNSVQDFKDARSIAGARLGDRASREGGRAAAQRRVA